MDYHECFEYIPEIGRLRWKKRPRHHFPTTRAWNSWNVAWSGKLAGTPRMYSGICKGCFVGIGGKQIAQHTIIWTMMVGPIPPGHIVDHKDRNPGNNRLENLRVASPNQNAQNASRRKDNTSGLKGVIRTRHGKWGARINANNIEYWLGTFDSKGMAALSRAKMALKLHGKFASF